MHGPAPPQRAVAPEGIDAAAPPVDLVGAHDHVHLPVSVEVADRGGGDDARAERRGRIGVAHEDRPAADRCPVAPPRVEVLVHGAHHDVQHAVAVEVGQHGRAGDAAVDDVGRAAVLGTRERGIGLHGEPGQPPSRTVPDVDLSLQVRDHHLRVARAVDVPHRDAADEGCVRGSDSALLVGRGLEVVVRSVRVQARDQVRVDGPSGQDRAVAADSGHRAVGGGHDDLRGAVPVQVRERRRGLARSPEGEREAGMKVGVVMDEDRVAVLGLPAVHVDDPQPQGDGEVVRRRGRPAREGEEVADVPRGQRFGLRVGARAGDADRHEVFLERLDAEAVVDRVAVRAGAAGGHAARDFDRRRLCRIERLVPVRPPQVGLGRDRARRDRLHGRPGVHPAVTVVLVPAGLARIEPFVVVRSLVEHVVGRQRRDLLHLVGGERRRQEPLIEQVAAARNDEGGHAAPDAGGARRAAVARHRQLDVGAVVGAARMLLERRRQRRESCVHR